VLRRKRARGTEPPFQKKRRKKTKAPKKRGRKGQSPPGIRRKKRQRRGVICPSFFEGTGGGWPGFNDPFFNGKKKHSTTTKDRKTRQTKNNLPLPAFSKTPDYIFLRKMKTIILLPAIYITTLFLLRDIKASLLFIQKILSLKEK